MIHRLREVTNGLFRGSAPTPQDVAHLKENFGIKKIVSLDQYTGQKIDRTTKLLGIKHIMLPINGSHSSLLKFLKHNLEDLFIKDGPTFVHCAEGKDRTGLAIALFKCKYMGMRPEKAIEEAKSLGFGLGVDPSIISLYEKIIKSCKPIKNKDVNNSDIVSNEREYIGDNRDSFLDEGHQGSFAPYLSVTRQNPMDSVYNEINDQSPTRENYPNYKSIKEHNDESSIPEVGTYNNNAGIHGAGPAEPVGGFIYD